MTDPTKAQPDRITRERYNYELGWIAKLAGQWFKDPDRRVETVKTVKATLNAYADQCEADLDAVHSDCQEALGHLHDAEVKLEKALQRTKEDATTIKALVKERDKANDRARLDALLKDE